MRRLTDMYPYDAYAISMGYRVGEVVPPRHSIRKLIEGGHLLDMVAAANNHQTVTLSNEVLLHLLNILIPQIKDL